MDDSDLGFYFGYHFGIIADAKGIETRSTGVVGDEGLLPHDHVLHGKMHQREIELACLFME